MDTQAACVPTKKSRPRRLPWTPAEDAALREMRLQGKQPSEIAAALGRSLYSVLSRASDIGELTQPRFTADQDAEIRRLHALRVGDADIARRIGRDAGAVRRRRRRLGLSFGRSRGLKWNPAFVERLRGMAARGATLPELLAEVGWKYHHSVTHEFNRLGIPYPKPDPAADARALAARYGLPADLDPRAVQVAVLLLSGPLTKAGIRAAVGRVLPKVTAALRRKGLVAFLPGPHRRPTSGRGLSRQTPGTFFLTAKALELMSRAGGAA